MSTIYDAGTTLNQQFNSYLIVFFEQGDGYATESQIRS